MSHPSSTAHRILVIAAPLALALAACGDDATGDTITDAEGLSRALGAAAPGDIVSLGEIVLDGSFTVPAGVTLEGAGDGTVLRAAGGGALVLLGGDASQPTAVRGVRVEVPAAAGAVAAITARDGGFVALSDVDVSCDVGLGIIVSVDDVELTTVTIHGGLTDEDASTLSASTVSPDDQPVAGLIVEGGVARLRGVDVSDFAGFGVVLSNTAASWDTGAVAGVLGTGVLVEASDAELVDVVVRDGRVSSVLGSFSLPYGVVSARDSLLTSSGLQVVANPGIGMLQDGSRSQHLDLRVVGNGDAGVWVQRRADATAAEPAVLVSGGLLQSNGRVGLGGFDLGGVVLDQTLIVDTRPLPGVSGETGAITISDGLQLRQVDAGAQALVLNDSLVFGQGRAGLLADDGVIGTSDAATALAVCGPGRIDRDRWSCENADDGAIRCTRTTGPPVPPVWTCADTEAGTQCESSDPAAVAAGLPPVLPLPPVTAGVLAADGTLLAPAPDDDACAGRLDDFVARTGVVLGTGLLVDGALDPVAVVGENGVGFECGGGGGTIACTTDVLDRAGRSLDNPTWDDGPGWTCGFDEAGRTCVWGGAGIVERGGADLSGLLPSVERFGSIDVRDAALLDAGAFDQTSYLAESPLRVGVVGENGVMAEGAVGARGVVGENGVMVRGVVGENGFQ